MRVLALDFDGVVSDSAPEAFVVAARAWLGLRPQSALRESLEPLLAAPAAGPPRPWALTRERVGAHPLYGPFLAMMPLGNRAEDYAVELAALETGAVIDDQAAYDRHRASQPAGFPAFLERFHARFYQERDTFAARDPAGWQQLLGPYPEFVALLRRRAADVRLALATAKDRASVGRLLQAYTIADLFEDEFVLDKEAGVSKRAHLEALHERTGAAFEAITFVDDKVNHLEDVAPLGVRCALAAWGYNGAREHERARARGFAVCTLADAEAQLFDA